MNCKCFKYFFYTINRIVFQSKQDLSTTLKNITRTSNKCGIIRYAIYSCGGFNIPMLCVGVVDLEILRNEKNKCNENT